VIRAAQLRIARIAGDGNNAGGVTTDVVLETAANPLCNFGGDEREVVVSTCAGDGGAPDGVCDFEKGVDINVDGADATKTASLPRELMER